jgi:hypothetical protein
VKNVEKRRRFGLRMKTLAGLEDGHAIRGLAFLLLDSRTGKRLTTATFRLPFQTRPERLDKVTCARTRADQVQCCIRKKRFQAFLFQFAVRKLLNQTKNETGERRLNVKERSFIENVQMKNKG